MIRRFRPAAARRAAAVTALALAAAGCGIRGTSVPVDAGDAPSRVSCHAPETGAPVTERVRVYLVCGSTLVPVERAVPRPQGTPGAAVRLPAARALLAELQKPPTAEEIRAGFNSAVPEALRVDGPRAGDAPEALRLSVEPDDLPSLALAQLVCTYGRSAALGRTGGALLGGPGGAAAHRYDCSPDVQANPNIAQQAGWGDPQSQEG
ncbi:MULTISPECIES: lipoprotein [Streptomyces]|uniref:Lipoprotein n=1 Tax=Streptomyces yunnanensis TaxID=156453 RepID=A0ABY8AAQ6_9ACTN|nr:MULTISPECIES: lipoprotein [Streptomyces]AJC56362.1 putative lipoprotein [Streptomyces sp. 769]WEB40766.1 hypothetical protein MOV08_16755 [Streptomyces yunnanensis]